MRDGGGRGGWHQRALLEDVALANVVVLYEYFMEYLRPIFHSFQQEKCSDIIECVSQLCTT
jgi:hypothetical protein